MLHVRHEKKFQHLPLTAVSEWAYMVLYHDLCVCLKVLWTTLYTQQSPCNMECTLLHSLPVKWPLMLLPYILTWCCGEMYSMIGRRGNRLQCRAIICKGPAEMLFRACQGFPLVVFLGLLWLTRQVLRSSHLPLSIFVHVWLALSTNTVVRVIDVSEITAGGGTIQILLLQWKYEYHNVKILILILIIVLCKSTWYVPSLLLLLYNTYVER